MQRFARSTAKVCGFSATGLCSNADGRRAAASYRRRRTQYDHEGGTTMKKLLEWGGVAAGIVLIAFGVAAIVLGVNGRSTVQSSLKLEQIVGTPDMTPAAIRAEAQKAGLPAGTPLPTVAVAGKAINTGDRARAFASYMRIHALEATQGYTYAQMGQYEALPTTPKSELASPGSTSNTSYAVIDPKTQLPVANGARNVWVTETALTTALNTSYMAEQLAVFGIVVGVALLLSGIGFLILAAGGALRGARGIALVHRPETTTKPVTV
jgi:hypothetical protein